jgi:hypothetical protein
MAGRAGFPLPAGTIWGLQSLAILFGAAFTAAVAFNLGAILLRNSCTDPGVRFVSGASVLSLLVFSAGLLGLLYPATFLLMGAAAIALARTEWRMPKRPRPTRWWLLFGPFLVLYLANAMAPEISYDGSRYHLGLVSRYLREHGIHPITDNLYSAFSQGVEMLYVFAFAFGRHSAAAMVHFTFLLALVWQIYAWSRRQRFPLAGLCAAALVFVSPAVGVDGTSAYNDVAVAAIAFTLFHVLELWSENLSPRLLATAGLLAGFAFAAKYTAFLAVPYAIGFVLWKTRRLRSGMAVAAYASIGVLPWLLKNYFWFQNPLAPLFNHFFRNPYVSESFEATYVQNLMHYGLRSRWEIPLQVTTYGSLAGLLGPVFLLSPMALLALRWRPGRHLLLAAAIFGATYFSNISTRFLLPALPFVALAMCLVLVEVPRAAIGIVVLHAVLSWPSVVRRYSHADAWRLVKVTYREALRIKPEEGFLESNLPYYGVTRMIERATPAGSTVFTEVPIPEAYTSRKILVSYQSTSNVVSRRVWFMGFVPEHAPVRRLRFAFSPQTASGIRIIQTNTAPGTWTIHEVRAFDGARELPRAEWHATAHPYPWGIEAALDDRLTSFWMCGQTLTPGQFVEFDFPRPERLDSVVIETSPDQPGVGTVLQTRNVQVWTPVPGAPREQETAPPPDLRRAAAAELKRRGIDYLLMFDGEFGADDLSARSADWGVRETAEYKGARLYQLR